jgi:hypothetical protein
VSAMPLPIVPAPQTPTVWISMRRNLSGSGRKLFQEAYVIFTEESQIINAIF